MNFEPGLLERPVHFSARLSHQCAAIAAVQRFEGLGCLTALGRRTVEHPRKIGSQSLARTRMAQSQGTVQIVVAIGIGRPVLLGQATQVLRG